MSIIIELGKKVYHEAVYNGKELLEIIGIRKTEVELKGDYSGGTHNVTQSSWMPINGVIDPDKIVCPNKIDGHCPLHNLHCGYPDCEIQKNPINNQMKITIDFFKEIHDKINAKEITISKGIELLNEEAQRQPTADELGIFNRKECVFKFCPNEHLCQEKCVNS